MAICALAVSSFATSAQAAFTMPGVRATWLPVSVPVASPAAMQALLLELADIGVNMVYIDVWNNGVAYFNSTAVRRFAGERAVSADDRLRWAVDAASLLTGLEVAAWIEYGLMACHGPIAGNIFAEAAQSSGWIIGQSGGWQWLDPPAAVPLLASMASEIGMGYGVRIQLDDHFACPAALPLCSEAKMDVAARAISAIGQHVSLSPSPAAFAQQKFHVNWLSWAAQGLFEEFVPQLYTESATAFEDALHVTLNEMPLHSPPVVAGIRVDGSGDPTSWTEVSRMLDVTASANATKGVAIWYADGICKLYPSSFKAKWA